MQQTSDDEREAKTPNCRFPTKILIGACRRQSSKKTRDEAKEREEKGKEKR